MKKLVKILVFVLVLFLMGCGEKKEELTGLHKEFDIIFNGIKEQATSEFNANKENRDLLKEFGKKAKEFLGKTMLGHQDFYKYLEDNSLIEKLK